MKVRSVDLETSGRPEDAVKGICEVGWADVTIGVGVWMPNSFLTNPGHPMPPEVRAIHHISDQDLVGAPDPGVGIAALMNGMEEGDVFCAHNASFEQAFFGGGNHRWICTMKCAKHLYPEAPSFSNQALRYWLDVDRGFHSPELAMPPHRAGPDAYVTAFILQSMLGMADVDELVRLTSAPIILSTVGFGKHRGANWSELPNDYLGWIAYKSDMGPNEKHTARHYLGEV